MKIGIVIIHCLKNRSSRYVNEITRYFVDAGHEVHVFTNKWDELDSRVKIHKIPTLSTNFNLREIIFTLFATLIMKFKRFDITMAQATRYFRPDVCYMQFVYKKWSELNKQNTFRDKIISDFEYNNLKKSKKIIAMSKVIKNQITSSYKIPDNKIAVVYSGVNLNRFSPQNRKYRKEIRKSWGVSEKDVILLFVGNPYKRKGLHYLVEALPKINQKAKVVVMGRDHSEDKFEDYKRLAEKNGVGERLIYGGFSTEVYKYFAAADMFVFPTLYEPFGLVILEAMASGLPVITNKHAGAAELIDDGKEGVLLENPHLSTEIANHVNFIINNGLVGRMGTSARKKAENYSWKNAAKNMLRILETCTNRK